MYYFWLIPHLILDVGEQNSGIWQSLWPGRMAYYPQTTQNKLFRGSPGQVHALSLYSFPLWRSSLQGPDLCGSASLSLILEWFCMAFLFILVLLSHHNPLRRTFTFPVSPLNPFWIFHTSWPYPPGENFSISPLTLSQGFVWTSNSTHFKGLPPYLVGSLQNLLLHLDHVNGREFLKLVYQCLGSASEHTNQNLHMGARHYSLINLLWSQGVATIRNSNQLPLESCCLSMDHWLNSEAS